MNQNLAATDYPPSAVHSMLQVERDGSMTAAQLIQILGLEKSSVSRMLAKLVESGELAENPSAEDARTKLLSLTGKGRKTVQNINAYADQRVAAALNKLDPVTQEAVSKGLSSYASALKACRENTPGKVHNSFKIVQGYHEVLLAALRKCMAAITPENITLAIFLKQRLPQALLIFRPVWINHVIRSG